MSFHPRQHDYAPQDEVVLVDGNDTPLGRSEKLAAHRQGLLHRAVSGFVFDADGRLLIQRRARAKYHCGGLWANTCCSHPRPGETPLACMGRRLREELGFSTPMRPFGHTTYRCHVSDGLIEHEFVHGFCGAFAGAFSPNAAEVEDVRWVTVPELDRMLTHDPHALCPWFATYLRTGFAHLAQACEQQARRA